MSYRIYMKLELPDGTAKEFQAFGNNEFPKQVENVLKKLGCNTDDDYFDYFEIKDLNSIIEATEEYIKEEYLNNKNIANFTKSFENGCKTDLTSEMMYLQNYAYIFASANIINFIGEKNIAYTIKKKTIYNLKPGVKLFIKGS